MSRRVERFKTETGIVIKCLKVSRSVQRCQVSRGVFRCPEVSGVPRCLQVSRGVMCPEVSSVPRCLQMARGAVSQMPQVTSKNPSGVVSRTTRNQWIHLEVSTHRGT